MSKQYLFLASLFTTAVVNTMTKSIGNIGYNQSSRKPSWELKQQSRDKLKQRPRRKAIYWLISAAFSRPTARSGLSLSASICRVLSSLLQLREVVATVGIRTKLEDTGHVTLKVVCSSRLLLILNDSCLSLGKQAPFPHAPKTMTLHIISPASKEPEGMNRNLWKFEPTTLLIFCVMYFSHRHTKKLVAPGTQNL